MAKSLWDEFKDLFKTKEQREQEKRDGINDALKREKDVVQQLEELEQQYRDSLPKQEEPDLEQLFPSDSGLKEMEYEAETDEQIEERAKKESESKKALDKEKVENDFEQDRRDMDLKKQSEQNSLQQKFEALDAGYDAKEENASDDALRQGIARGSILSSVLGELSENERREKAAATGQYLNKVEEIDAKLSNLEKARDEALEELDMKYAIQLSKDIAELKKERDEEVKKNEKYNQDIRRQQAEYAYEREQDINEYLAELERRKEEQKAEEQRREEKYGYSGEKQQNYAKRYEIAYDFYMSLDPSIALDALDASPNMKYYLGLYYDKLRAELKDRSSSTKYYF